MMTPIARCAVCSKLCTADEFLVVLPVGGQPRDDIGRLKGYCERCYCAVGVVFKQRWQRAMRDPGPCTCEWKHHAFYWSERLSPPCESCMDKQWHVSNLKTVVWELRMATKDKPGAGLRAYNRWGRCVSWSK